VAPLLLGWYEASARDLPWRRSGVSPWAVLVSEFMLQQTPVTRVLPAYDAWLARWPTPASLAAEPAGEAIRQWNRLGYPRRAVRLHAAAQRIVDRHDGEVPDALNDLLALPGVGGYTARAVASFAFGQRHPVVDTNVRRVLHRYLRGTDGLDPGSRAADRQLAETVLPADPAVATACGVALMELGALVCTARAPGCDRCPLAVTCRRLAVAPKGVGWPLEAARSEPRRRQPSYAGSDRHARGELLRALRASRAAVPPATLLAAWSEPAQGARALASLLTDGLAVRLPDGTLTLP
jgi:A/G-specific adenine glycosylase